MVTDGSALELRSHTYQELRESSWTCKDCGVPNSFVPVAQQPVGLLVCEECHKPVEAGTQVFSNILEILPDCIVEQTPGSKRSTGFVCCKCGMLWRRTIKAGPQQPKRSVADFLLRRNKSEKRKQKPEGLVAHLVTFHFSTSVCKFCAHKCCENCLRFRLREKGISSSAATTADLVEEVKPPKSPGVPKSADGIDAYVSRFPLNEVRGLRIQTQLGAAQTTSPQAPPVSPVSAKLLLDNPTVESPDFSDSASIISLDSEVEYGVAEERKFYKVSKPTVIYRRPANKQVSVATISGQKPSDSLPETKQKTVQDQKEDEDKALKESTDAVVRGLLKLGFL